MNPNVSFISKLAAIRASRAFLTQARCNAIIKATAAFGLWIGFCTSAHACPCDAMSPVEGFELAQYVFTGRVIETSGHTWTVDVDRVWKGAERLAPKVRLLDVYLSTNCEFFFETGHEYLFFAIVAKSSRYAYYQPEVCNWTSALRSKQVPDPDGRSEWLEDFIQRRYGPGEAPQGKDPWERLQSKDSESKSSSSSARTEQDQASVSSQ
jgi:hypothetical protein